MWIGEYMRHDGKGSLLVRWVLEVPFKCGSKIGLSDALEH